MADDKTGTSGGFGAALQGIGKMVGETVEAGVPHIAESVSAMVLEAGLSDAATLQAVESDFEVTEASADASALVEGAREAADAYEVSEDREGGRAQSASWAAQQAGQAAQAASQAQSAAAVETLQAAVADEAEAVEVETHTEERQQEAAAQKKREDEEADAAADRQAAEQQQQQQEAREQQQEAHEAEMARIEEERLEAEAEAEAEAEQDDESDPYSD